jgi:ECF sigma factor
MDPLPPEGPAQVTVLLRQWREGDRSALDRLIPLVYDELHIIASRHMAREWRAQSLQTTALVNEAYVKLVGQGGRRRLAEPRAFLRRCGAGDAPHSARRGAASAAGEARRRRDARPA